VDQADRAPTFASDSTFWRLVERPLGLRVLDLVLFSTTLLDDEDLHAGGGPVEDRLDGSASM